MCLTRSASVKRPALYLVTIILLSALSVPGEAQQFSERRDVAIFRLNYYGAPRDPVPERSTTVQLGNVFRFERTVERDTTEIFQRAVGAVDERIRSVFINMGRFNVIGLDKRLQTENVDAFVRTLQNYREQQVEIPETVLLGQEAFTEADFEQIVGGFIVVIPSVSYYNVSRDDDGEYDATIETSFTFINVDTMQTEGQFFIETSGSDDDAADAMKSAVDGIPLQLEFRLRELEIFRIRTGIVDVRGQEVILELGRNMGIQRGDEYAIIQPRLTNLGYETEDESGVLLIKEVREQFSIAQVLYSRPNPIIGDQLEEIPRIGIEITPYAELFSDLEVDNSIFVLGLRATASRGFYRFRPLGGIEIPFTSTLIGLLFPMDVYIGGDANWYLGRIKVNPSITGGLGGGVPLVDDLFGQDFYLSHVGGTAKVGLSYLVSRDTMVNVQLGYARWIGLYDRYFNSAVVRRFFDGYGGILIGAGVTFK